MDMDIWHGQFWEINWLRILWNTKASDKRANMFKNVNFEKLHEDEIQDMDEDNFNEIIYRDTKKMYNTDEVKNRN